MFPFVLLLTEENLERRGGETGQYQGIRLLYHPLCREANQNKYIELTANYLTSLGIDTVADNVKSSDKVSDEISSEIKEVDAASTSIMDDSNQVKQSASELADLADELKDLVERFKL